MVETMLSGSRDGKRHALGMPTSDTRNFTKTTVGFARKTGHSPSLDHTLKPVPTRHTADIRTLGLLKHRPYMDLSLQQPLSVGHLVRNLTPIDLDLRNKRLTLSHMRVPELPHLRMRNHPKHRGTFQNLPLLLLRRAFPLLRRQFQTVLTERPLLAAAPVAVEPPAALITEVLGPDRPDTAQPVRRLAVPHEPHHHHRGGLHNGHRLDHLLLVHLTPGAVHVTHDVRHARLEPHERGEVGGRRRVVPREGADAAADVAAALLREEAEVAVPGVLEFAVGHGGRKGEREREGKREREREEKRKRELGKEC